MSLFGLNITHKLVIKAKYSHTTQFFALKAGGVSSLTVLLLTHSSHSLFILYNSAVVNKRFAVDQLYTPNIYFLSILLLSTASLLLITLSTSLSSILFITSFKVIIH